MGRRHGTVQLMTQNTLRALYSQQATTVVRNRRVEIEQALVYGSTNNERRSRLGQRIAFVLRCRVVCKIVFPTFITYYKEILSFEIGILILQ